MRFGIYTLDDFNVKGKTVLCRVDMNQPVDRATGTLKSSARIRACAPTVKELSEKGAKVVLLAHQGSDIEYKNFYTTAPHAKVLSEYVGREVMFIDDVADVHFLFFRERNGNDSIALQITRKDPAGYRIGVHADH